MKAFVITIEQLPQSVEVAKRCIASGKKHGVHVEHWKATTPEDKPIDIFKEEGLSPRNFSIKFSRKENVLSCFLSHYFLWKACAYDPDREPYMILEHDAVFVDSLPKLIDVSQYPIINFGKPSYGRYCRPKDGLGTLLSKRHLPGAHAYTITQNAAMEMLKRAKERAEAADIFIGHRNFSTMIYEYFPWPVEVDDSFTTVQHEVGCRSKHNNGPNFKILEV